MKKTRKKCQNRKKYHNDDQMKENEVRRNTLFIVLGGNIERDIFDKQYYFFSIFESHVAKFLNVQEKTASKLYKFI